MPGCSDCLHCQKNRSCGLLVDVETNAQRAIVRWKRAEPKIWTEAGCPGHVTKDQTAREREQERLFDVVRRLREDDYECWIRVTRRMLENVKTFKLIPVASVGHHHSIACCSAATTLLPDYPASPRADIFRVERIRQGLSLRDAAKLLNLSPMELSSLERGSATLSDEDWNVVLQAIGLTEY